MTPPQTTPQDPADSLADRTFTPLNDEATAKDPALSAPAAPEKPSSAQIISGAVAAGREVFCLVAKLQSPKVHLDDATAQQLGALWGPVLDKHGIDLGQYLGDYALEIAAVIGTVTIGAGVRSAVLAEIAAKDAAARPGDGISVTRHENSNAANAA